MEEWLEALGILQNNQGRSQAAPLAASRQRTRCRDRPQPQRPSRIPRASYHSGTDAARVCQSSLPASLPVKPHHPQNSSKYLKKPAQHISGRFCAVRKLFDFKGFSIQYHKPYVLSIRYKLREIGCLWFFCCAAFIIVALRLFCNSLFATF